VDVERMMHRMVRSLHLVHQPDLDLVSDCESPVDRMILRLVVSVD
jgi:hypothetical protein